ncbi:M4 family metallopeptidase [Vitiosangium sp. GDMCC 1.1324]|uniref:M4 family metallopeptidase n=1 Tax=Vitiosangium sp. (strain GDMCC 1.1324) TaxID=2138576 RepID=UPI000D39EF40|nr:M4 family metallopeptidase [Vitiosangium sp. GDMCC 1.1324]PTL82834.1 peptidase [Vitiosangium sp. GDMCC 1.1324]
MMSACTEGSPASANKVEGTRTLKSALGNTVVDADEAGVARFITGELGSLPATASPEAALKADLSPALASIAPQFRLDPANLVLKRARADAQGDIHYRYGVRHNGRAIYGGEVILHARGGKIIAANTNVRGDLKGPEKATVAPEAAITAAAQDRAAPKAARESGSPELFYYRAGDKLLLVYEVRQTGEQADGTPVDDSVLVNAADGSVVERIPHVHTGLGRKLYDGKNTSTLPGTLTRSEGEAAVADPIVNENYDHLGTVYNCYSSLFGRDSIDNAGATLISTVHHRVAYVNAFWDGTQMVYGDGDGTTAINLAKSLDVTAHELTHAVTDYESELIYSGESGGLNESLSDIFGAVCEWYGDGKVVSAETWLVGDDIWTPSIPGDALRYMANPTQDGDSLDYYPDYYSGIDVHYSSGISNLAFYLLSQGGTHPTGKTTTAVAGIGIEKASRIFYKANADIMTPSTTFEQAKIATEQAAQQLGYDAATIASVTNAWKAVGVGVPIPPPPSTPVNKNVPVTDISGAKGSKVYYNFNVPEGAYDLQVSITGGTGDSDLYVRFANAPTTSQYDCRPYKSGNEESCAFATPSQGTWYVMLNGYSAYSGVTLKVTWKGGYIPIESGVKVTGISGAAGSEQIFKLVVPPRSNGNENNHVHVRIYGGSGNADLYVQRASAPNTFEYDCRDVKEHNNENCNLNNVPAGNYYILVYGAKGGFENLTLDAMYQK